MNEINDVDFRFVRELIHEESAISIEPDMKYLVESRLSTLVRKTDHADVAALISCLRSKRDRTLVDQVVDAMTTNETSFFRDSHPFDTLCTQVLPAIAESHNEPIRIWCAACSTGQEAYTIAMAVLENCPRLASRISIVGTDISAEVVAKAQAGIYNRLEVNRGLPAQLLARYFTQQGLVWQVKPELMKMVSFHTLNLIRDWGTLPSMDVIFLRNVLIYFEPNAKSAILRNTSRLLKPGGCLFLGLSETTLNLNTDYQRVTAEKSHYYKIA